MKRFSLKLRISKVIKSIDVAKSFKARAQIGGALRAFYYIITLTIALTYY